MNWLVFEDNEGRDIMVNMDRVSKVRESRANKGYIVLYFWDNGQQFVKETLGGLMALVERDKS